MNDSWSAWDKVRVETNIHLAEADEALGPNQGPPWMDLRFMAARWAGAEWPGPLPQHTATAAWRPWRPPNPAGKC